jgi:Kelch motif protein
MPTARYGLAAVTGTDGRISTVGGSTNTANLRTAEAYDPTTNTWTTVASMIAIRSDVAAASGSDGRIYAIGGFRTVYLNSAEAYRP